MKLKKFIAFFLLPMFLLFVSGCDFNDKKEIKIGVAMPTKTRQRWNQDGANIEKGLRNQGYVADLQYADNKPELQISQIAAMINEGCKVIIVGAVDVNSLAGILEEAKSAGIAVISYDRLIMNTDAVDYYATFDNLAVGIVQGEYIEDKLGLKDGKGPYNLEITAGSEDDSNAFYFFEGAMEILRPYIKSGKLVVNSGQTTFKECAISHWKENISRERMTGILQKYYANKNLDVALCANDSTAFGVINALRAAGYNKGDKKMPLITGQDADKKNLKMIVSGEQTMSIFKDTRILADQTVKMVKAIVEGKDPETNDMGNYYNGVKILPSFLIRPLFVDKDNYREVLFDSGYYNESVLEE